LLSPKVGWNDKKYEKLIAKSVARKKNKEGALGLYIILTHLVKILLGKPIGN